MFRIGPFSLLSGVSIKTLRFYDEIGLLPPAFVDDESGYRYYRADQLPRLNRILALKSLGFTLEQIGPVLAEGVSLESLQEMLRRKEAELEAKVAEEQRVLEQVRLRLKQIEQEGKMSTNEVVLKRIEPQQVASVREILPNYPGVGRLFGKLMETLHTTGTACAGPGIAIWHDNGFKENDVDGEAAIPITGTFLEKNGVRPATLPGVETMACLVHHGSYARFMESYTELGNWIEQNGYQVVGPSREVYLETKGDGNQHDESCVTEIQFPVRKA